MDKLRSRILSEMGDKLNSDQITELGKALDICFYDYEIIEKSRDLSTCGDINRVVLKNFLGTKIGEGCSDTTIKEYNYIITRLLEEINKPVTDITTNDIRYHLATYQMERGCSNTTINNMRCYYSSFFKWLSVEQIIPTNPMDRIKAIKTTKKQLKPFTEKEIEKLIDACTNTRDRAIVEFLYSTGCRATECISANISDINFKNNSFLIRKGKGAKERTVYISERCMIWLEKYLSTRTDSDDALWIGRQGRLTRHGLEAIIRRLGKRANVEDAHPHKYRHTFATDLIKRGASIQVVKELLGHESIETTMIYVTMMDGEAERTYRKLIA